MPRDREVQTSRAQNAHPASASKEQYENDVEEQYQGHSRGQLSFSSFMLLAWSSIGVIFGDIATSPLYVYDSIFQELVPDGAPEKDDIMGCACLIFWTLTLVVMVKYIGVVLMADDQGQGGTFALYSLLCRNMGIKPHGARCPTGNAVPSAKGTASGLAADPSAAADGTSSDSEDDCAGGGKSALRPGPRPWWRRCAMSKRVFQSFFQNSGRAQIGLWGVAVIATAMLMGDGVLTPAMSVLSAVSGLNVVAPNLGQNVIIGVTILVLFLVFALQPLGTGQVGVVFAPIISIWLLANAAINCYNLSRYGGAVFAAINPAYIGTYFSRHGSTAWRSLGAVMLSVTGAEALFADLGHFSRGSISVAFCVLAYPCLVITYFGQASYLISHNQDTDAFWKSLPSPLLYPMLILATLATIVASQALISGIFSIIRQAMILGAFPPARIVHTGGKNPAQATQVYIPLVNVVLFALCCIVVGGFQSTVALGKAYGLAVMTDMMTTTCLVTLVMLSVWEVSLFLVVPFFGLFVMLEGAYWSANIIKVPQGGWFTLAVAAVVSLIMLIWWAGSRRLGERLAAITAGAHIRLLGRPAPPPLLKEPPPLVTSPSALAAQSVAVGTPKRLLYRLTNWALAMPRRSSSDKDLRPVSAPPLRGARAAHAATSMPLMSLGPKHSASVRYRPGGSIGRPAMAGSWRGGRELQGGAAGTAFAEADADGAVATDKNAARPPAATSTPMISLDLQPQTSLDSPARPAPLGSAERRAATAAAVAAVSDGGVDGFMRGRLVSESSFTPGTLALVQIAEEGEDAYGGGAAAALLAAAAGANGGDVETGGAATAAAAALLAPVVVPLTSRLPGIGVYYMDEKIGGANATLTSLPPVLVHFTANVQAIHEVCVFLSVRSLPTPTIARRQRLQVYTPLCAAAPNFYQVVARYGYLDVIDHGPGFISELADAILKRLVAVEERANRGRLPRAYSMALQSVRNPYSKGSLERDTAATGVLPPWDELTDKPLARQAQNSSMVTLTARIERSVRAGATPRAGAPPLPTLEDEGKEGFALADGVSEPLPMKQQQHQHLQPPPPAQVSLLLRAESAPPGTPKAAEATTEVASRSLGVDAATAATAHRDALAAARAQVEEAVAAFLEARVHGVVYYGSRALIRVNQRPGRSMFAQFTDWFIYGTLFKWLAVIAYVDVERWRVPSKHLVELGMPVYI